MRKRRLILNYYLPTEYHVDFADLHPAEESLDRAAEPSGAIQVSPLLAEIAGCDAQEVFRRLETGDKGLSEEEAAARLEQHGPNVVAKEERFRRTKILAHACANPLVILLLVLAFVTYFSDEAHDIGGPAVMLVMVVLGVDLPLHSGVAGRHRRRKTQGHDQRHGDSAPRGAPRELPLGHLVPGDVIQLAAGDMIPGRSVS